MMSVIQSVMECASSKGPPAGIAHSPQSRAMYGVDMMLAWQRNAKGKVVSSTRLNAGEMFVNLLW